MMDTLKLHIYNYVHSAICVDNPTLLSKECRHMYILNIEKVLKKDLGHEHDIKLQFKTLVECFCLQIPVKPCVSLYIWRKTSHRQHYRLRHLLLE